jgi:ABC-2 type transport system ATP-binding protein
LDRPVAIEFQNVFKSFAGQTVLRSFQLTVPKGSFYLLLGANGAGKTTALRMLAGLSKPDFGSIFVNGVNIAKDPSGARRCIAYFPDIPLLYPLLSPLEYLEFVATLWNMDAQAAYRRSTELLKWLGLWDHRNKLTETFSQGMKQKLAFVAGVLHDPDILLLDEPLTGLDIGAAKMIKDLMRELVTQGKTVVLTTHIMELVGAFDCRVGILGQGRVVAEGTVDELRQLACRESVEDIFIQLAETA